MCIKTKIGYITIEEENNYIVRVLLEREDSNDTNEILSSCTNQILEYLDGKRKAFDIPIRMYGTPFQIACWKELLNIEYGKTVSYSDIAIAIGNPKAVRAIGQAIHNNPIAIIVPCHRVIGKNKKLVGYAYGIDVKQQLLKLERNSSCL